MTDRTPRNYIGASVGQEVTDSATPADVRSPPKTLDQLLTETFERGRLFGREEERALQALKLDAAECLPSKST